MTTPGDKTLVQRPQDATRVQQTVVHNRQQRASQPHSTQAHSTRTEVRTACTGMVLKQRFELLELLGAGGMGAVYKARDLRQVEAGDADPWVAVKVINESFACHEHALVSLQQETKKTQRLSHPNIVTAYDFDRDHDIAFMTMELLQGESLDQLLLKHRSGLSTARALHIVRQVTAAVTYAHQQGIVHADIKPANIFITSTGQVKVLDFGIARAIYTESVVNSAGGETSNGVATNGPTNSGATVQGFTPAYASVAVLGGAMPQQRDDLYALGCIFYMLFSGEHPYKRCRATEAEAAQMKPARIAQLKRAQWQALKKLLAFRPADDLSLAQFRVRFFADKSNRPRVLALASSATLLILVVGWLGFNWFAHREHRAVVALLSDPSFRQVEQGARSLDDFSADDRLVVLDSARDPLYQNLTQVMHKLDSAAAFRKVQLTFAAVLPLYPDSSALRTLHNQFQGQLADYVLGIASQLQQRIDQRLYAENNPDFSTLVKDLEIVAPEHALLQQYDFKALLAREAGLAVYLGQKPLAQAIVLQAQKLFPDDRERFQMVLQGQSKYDAAGSSANAGDSQARVQQARVEQARVEQARPQGATQGGPLPDYQRAVQLAAGFDLQQRDQFASFVLRLQEDNPAQYQLLQSSLSPLSSHRAFAGWKADGAAKKTTASKRAADACPSNFANRGADVRYRCRDSLTANVKGPELVVIKGQGSTPGFAVSRSEITIADYNQFCRLYRQCAVRADSPLPVTELTLQQAQSYIQWLSAMTGKSYRLPTLAQWTLLARNDSGIRDHNCQVVAGGRQIRGGELRSASQGYPNSLGLINLFGNAAEWVTRDSQFLSVGGNANSRLADCVPLNQIPSSGAADPLQGFRVARALAN